NFQVVIRDSGNLTVTSAVTMSVSQTLTSIVVSPASASVATNATQQFSAAPRDQFATALTSQPSFGWTVSGGGSISASGLFTAGATAGGPFTVTATSGAVNGTAQVTVTSGSTPINVSPAADAYVRGGVNQNTKYGTATAVLVKNNTTADNNRNGYFRFPLTGVATVTSAKLRLFGNANVNPKATSVYSVA